MSTVKADNFTWRTGEATSQRTPTVTGDQVVRGTCKSWINFNGTGTIATRSTFNISGLVDNGVGDYTPSFTTSMFDSNYILTGVASTAAGAQPSVVMAALTSTSAYLSKSSSLIRIYTSDTDAVALNDAFDVNVTVVY